MNIRELKEIIKDLPDDMDVLKYDRPDTTGLVCEIEDIKVDDYFNSMTIM